MAASYTRYIGSEGYRDANEVIMQTQATAPMRRFSRTPTLSGALSETVVLPREAMHARTSPLEPASAGTVSTKKSAESKGNGRSHLRAARRYLIAAIACAAFAFIYAQFSHGVYSPFMTFMFAIPLVGGAAVSLGLHLAHAHEMPRTTRQAWALALASLTVASCLRGIFEIAGTSSPLLVVYLAAAAAFAIIAAVSARRSSK